MNHQLEFLKKRINNSRISIIKSALYEYDNFSETHFVKLIPSKIVDGNEYDSILSQIIIDFENEFQGHMLCFIGESSLTQLENPEELLSFEPITHLLPFSLIMNMENIYSASFFEQYTLAFGNEKVIVPAISVHSLMPLDIEILPFCKKIDFDNIMDHAVLAESVESYSIKAGESSLSQAA